MKSGILFLLVIFCSCQKLSKISQDKQPVKKTEEFSEKLSQKDCHQIETWIQYYQKENPDFECALFDFKNRSQISELEASILTINDKDFDNIYKPFLIFNKSQTKYLDFDSNQWFLGEDGTAAFEVDQQVVLVDVKSGKSTQIAFSGSSQWFEDGFWENDSVAVLVGNSYEKIPFVIRYNFTQNTREFYQYSDTLKNDSSYSKNKLLRYGIRVE